MSRNPALYQFRDPPRPRLGNRHPEIVTPVLGRRDPTPSGRDLQQFAFASLAPHFASVMLDRNDPLRQVVGPGEVSWPGGDRQPPRPKCASSTTARHRPEPRVHLSRDAFRFGRCIRAHAALPHLLDDPVHVLRCC